MTNPTERYFDAAVRDAMAAEWPHGPLVTASPDGLRDGSGLWRVFHECPDRRVVGDSGVFECRGCGQTFTYEARSQ